MDFETQVVLDQVVKTLTEQQGRFTLFHYKGDGTPWGIAVEWGKEDEESDMVGAASYGTGDTLAEAIKDIAKDFKVDLNPKNKAQRCASGL